MLAVIPASLEALTSDNNYAWAVDQLAKGCELGLYASMCAELDEGGEETDCFREELPLWDGSETTMRQTRTFGESGRTPQLTRSSVQTSQESPSNGAGSCTTVSKS